MTTSFDPKTFLCDWNHVEVTGTMGGRVVAGFDTMEEAHRALPGGDEIRRRGLLVKSREEMAEILYSHAYR